MLPPTMAPTLVEPLLSLGASSCWSFPPLPLPSVSVGVESDSVVEVSDAVVVVLVVRVVDSVEESFVPRVVGSVREVAEAVKATVKLVKDTTSFPDADIATVAAMSEEPQPYWK